MENNKKLSGKELVEEILLPFEYLPQNLLWEITYRCNLSCVYCYGSCPKTMKNELSPWQKRKLARKIIHELGTPVCFTGGEPSLDPQLLDLAKIFYKEGCYPSIITNGSGINEKTVAKYMKYFHHMKISIDTLSREEAAKVNSNPEAPRWAMNALELLEREGYDMRRVAVASELTPYQDFEKWKELMNYLGELGVGTVMGGPPTPRGRWAGKSFCVDSKAIDDLVRELRRKYPRTQWALRCTPSEFRDDWLLKFWISPSGSLKYWDSPLTFGRVLHIPDLLELFTSFFATKTYKTVIGIYEKLTEKQKAQLEYIHIDVPRVELKRTLFFTSRENVISTGPAGMTGITSRGDVLTPFEMTVYSFAAGRTYDEVLYIMTEFLGFDEDEVKKTIQKLLKKKILKARFTRRPDLRELLTKVKREVISC